jgi:NADPH:quinone reductase-like Zn-dependent oxidoreductase
MRAVRFHDYAGFAGLRFEEAPVPAIGRREVLVRVHAAGVNPFDWYAINGYVSQYVQFKLPAVLGRDVSGVIEEVGSDVPDWAVGEAVYGQTDPASHGTFAEYTAIDAFRLAKKSDRFTHIETASLPNVLLAAWNGLFSAAHGMNLQARERVLIHGAAGGIGCIAVQLATWRGAHAWGTASQGNLSFLRGLGAERAIDYTVAGWHENIGPVDAVLNTADDSAAPELCSLIRPGGCYVALRGLSESAFLEAQTARGVRCLAASGPASVADFTQMARIVATGVIKPIVSGVYPLAEFRHALERVAEGHVRGKLVLRVAD